MEETRKECQQSIGTYFLTRAYAGQEEAQCERSDRRGDLRSLCRLTAVIALLLLTVTVLGEAVYRVDGYPEELSRQMWDMIRLLRSRVIPAQGIAKDDVDKVFGEPWRRESGEQVYEILPHPGRSQKENEVFRGLNLNVRYQNGIVRSARIGPDSTTQSAKRDDGRYDDYTILTDLLKVHDKYCKRLKSAIWNKADPNKELKATDKSAP